MVAYSFIHSFIHSLILFTLIIFWKVSIHTFISHLFIKHFLLWPPGFILTHIFMHSYFQVMLDSFCTLVINTFINQSFVHAIFFGFLESLLTFIHSVSVHVFIYFLNILEDVVDLNKKYSFIHSFMFLRRSFVKSDSVQWTFNSYIDQFIH